MTKKLLRAVGTELTRRTDHDYPFAVVRSGGIGSFHHTFDAAVRAAKRHGGAVAETEVVGVPKKTGMTLDQVRALAAEHGFTESAGSPRVSGTLLAFLAVSQDRLIDVWAADDGTLKGPVLVIDGRRIAARATTLAELATALKEA